MPWSKAAGQWITLMAPRCKGCDQIIWLDLYETCSDCALYETGDLSPLPELPPITVEEWDRALA